MQSLLGFDESQTEDALSLIYGAISSSKICKLLNLDDQCLEVWLQTYFNEKVETRNESSSIWENEVWGSLEQTKRIIPGDVRNSFTYENN